MSIPESHGARCVERRHIIWVNLFAEADALPSSMAIVSTSNLHLCFYYMRLAAVF